MVGAGGIGCELLKNLVLTGFAEVHVIDLDTIDLSNLNRQFLFGHEHIKRSKALVAKETASRFNPHVKIEAHHANIKDPRFSLKWFRGFTLVFNALDNLEARRHVNKMCLAADVPLIESGTTGFNGQTQVIRKGISECYDCSFKETPKSFPVCTIRSTPSLPIHCIVWAKSYLFAEILGTSEDDAPDLDTTEDSDNAREIEQLREEAHALKRIRASMGSEDFPKAVFDKVFVQDIERLRNMEDMWRHRTKPNPLNFEQLNEQALGVGEAVADSDQVVWTIAENFAVFCTSLRRLSDRLEEFRANTDVGNAPSVLSFDKDDKDTLDFVTAAANLRSYIFGIDAKSEFETKRKSQEVATLYCKTLILLEMAGNIIPAIATTNAMTASMCVMQSFKVLRGNYAKARLQFLSHTAERLIVTEPLRPPNPECPVCGICQGRVDVDLSRATLRDLVEGVLKDRLAYGEDISISTEAGTIYDPDLEDNLDKLLASFDVKQDTFLTVYDESDTDPRINLVLAVSEETPSSEQPAVSLAEKVEVRRKAKQAEPEPEMNGHANGIVVPRLENGLVGGTKRKRDADGAELEAELLSKKGKVVEQAPAKSVKTTDDDIQIIDDTDGAIIID